MSEQAVKFYCYIAGIQVPLISFRVTAQVRNFCMGHVTMPWSPFLSKLHKGVKITVFSSNSDLPSPDGSAPIEFDGTIQGTIESKGNNPANNLVHLTIVSDGYIWTMKKKSTFDLTEVMNISTVAAQEGQNVDQNGMQVNTQVIDTATYVLGSTVCDNDGAKTAAIFLTCAYDSSDSSNCFYFCTNGSTHSQDGALYPEQIVNAGGVNWTTWMETYFGDYQLPYKVGYIAVSQATKDFFASNVAWVIIGNQCKSMHGVNSYWDIATHFANQMQCEIMCIPNPTYLQDTSGLDGKSETGLLAEFIIKPTTIFGNVPYCNVIFPDQIEERTVKVDYWKEVTRAFLPVSSVSPQVMAQFADMTGRILHGPTGLTDYMTSYNLVKAVGPTPDISIYEQVFGSCPVDVSMSEHIYRHLLNTNQMSKIQLFLDAEFLKFNFNKNEISITVTPDVRVLPGMSVLVLDRDGDHIIAYCSGTEYSWDCNGGASSSITLCYPHNYKLDLSELSEYANSLEGDTVESAKLALMIGSTFIPTLLMSDTIDSIFSQWSNIYGGDSRLMKKALSSKYQRSVASLADFITFHGSSGEGLIDNNGNLPTLMPIDMINKFDSVLSVNGLTMLSYNFLDPYSPGSESVAATAYTPDYTQIGDYGPIVPSFITSGVVDSHLKYLKRIANYVNI